MTTVPHDGFSDRHWSFSHAGACAAGLGQLIRFTQKLYHKAYTCLNMPPKKYKSQIAVIKAIIDLKRHTQLKKEWSEMRDVFDLIANEVETLPEYGDQYVSIDLKSLPEGTRAKLRRALANLAADDVVGCINDHPDGLMQTTTRYRKMLQGENIIINNPKKFEKYRRDVVKIVEFINADAETKFRKTSHTNDVTSHALRRKKNVIKLSFPEPVQWDKVTLKIKDGGRDMDIFYNKKHIKTVDHIDIGFYSGGKQKKPNRAWQFIIALSTLSVTDIKQATPNNLVCMFMPPKVNSQNVQQIKRQLVKKLCDLFATGSDPFHEYRGYYFPKFEILPEPELRKGKLWPQGGRFDDEILYGDEDIYRAEK